MNDSNVIAQVPNFLNALGVAVGLWHVVVTRPDGSTWTFGRNNFGQLGDSTLTNRSVPTLSLF